MYFFEETEADRGAVPPELVAALKDNDVRDMALRATGLSERSLRAIRDMIESARAVEGLAGPWNIIETGPATAEATSAACRASPLDEPHQLQFK